jgi:hypothetical protein
MARRKKRKLPRNLKLRYPAYHTVLYKGVPMWRCQAWALFDYEQHGGHLTVNSGIRRDSIVKRWRGKGLRKGYSSQKELYDLWVSYSRRYGREGAMARGVFPANPPGISSHEGYADGVARFHTESGKVARRGEEIVKYEWGIDAVQEPGGDASWLVRWLNKHGYKAERPYGSYSERHHMCFRRSPASRARLRLARWLATGK